ncbi:MAG: hypothetical protein Q7J73_03035 [Dehalococcoidales bacterium]|nr:hypothetical protein [Dehalococcoidales bacterium]
MNRKPIIAGVVATISLLGLYFGVASLISGVMFAKQQFDLYWYFMLLLTAGFGVQVGLYVYLRQLANQMSTKMSGGVVAVSGATSAGAMVACCAHYLVNLLPILGVTGLVGFVGQYQVELFWFGLAINLLAIVYIYGRISQITHYR